MTIGVIYKLTNKLTNKCYIGQTINNFCYRFCHRLFGHYTRAYKLKAQYKISKALRTYSKDNWILEIIDRCNKEELDEKEIYWIKYYNSFYDGYNSTKGGDINPMDGKTSNKKGKTFEELYGKEKAEMLKKKHSEDMMGRKASKETRDKMSASQKGKPGTRNGIPDKRKGKSYIDLYGEDKTNEILNKISGKRPQACGKTPWNKGLTKEVDARVSKQQFYRGGCG